MITLVKNNGQVKALSGASRYLLHTKVCGHDMYAKPGLRPIIGHIMYLFKFTRWVKE